MEQGQVEPVSVELGRLADLIRSETDFAMFLESPAIGIDEKKASLHQIFEQRFSKLVMDFLLVVADKDRLTLLLPIQSAYTDLEDRHAGRVRGLLTTAVELPERDKTRMAQQISSALGKTVTLETQVDASIIAGMILTVDDTVMDGSVKRSLQRLSQRLSQGADEQLQANRAIVD